MMKTTQSSGRAAGFTLVETAIVLTIVGLIIGGIWLGAATIQGNIKKNKLAEQTLRLAQNVKNFYMNKASTAGLNTGNTQTMQSILDAGLVPDDMIKGTDGAYQIVHAFNGSVDIFNQYGASGASNAIDTAFSITLNAIPIDVCIDLLSSRIAGNASTAKKIGFFGYSGRADVNGSLPNSTLIPATLDIARAECRTGLDAATNNTALTLYFDMN